MTERNATHNINVFPTEVGRTPQQALLQALELANQGGLLEILIMGVDVDDDIRFWMSDINHKSALWLVERAKQHIMEEPG